MSRELITKEGINKSHKIPYKLLANKAHLCYPLYAHLREEFPITDIIRPKYQALSWEELASKDFPKAPFLINPYVPEVGKTLLWADTSTGKTPLCWTMASCIGDGIPFMGLPTKKGRVLIIEMDTPEMLVHHRIRSWHYQWPRDVQFLFLPQLNIPNVDRAIAEAIMSTVSTFDPNLVIINSLRKCHSMDDKDSAAITMVYGWFERILGVNRASLFVHHERKSPTNPDWRDPGKEKFSGAKNLLNDVQVGIQLAKWRDPQKQCNLRLWHHKTQISAHYKPLGLFLDTSEQSQGTFLKAPLADELTAINVILTENPHLSTSSRDCLIADKLGMTERTAKRRRLIVEAKHFPGVEWLGRAETVDSEEDSE